MNPRQLYVRVRFAHTARFAKLCTPDEVAHAKRFMDTVVPKHPLPRARGSSEVAHKSPSKTHKTHKDQF